MKHRILGIFTALAISVVAASAATAPAKKKQAPVARKSVARKPTTPLQASVLKKRAVGGTSRTTATSNRQKTPVKPAVTWRNRQIQPTQDRYREIQQALATKGYLAPDQISGAWDLNSAGALKQFQTAQNLDASGKINSLSLIALGLGPRHDAVQLQPAQLADQSR